MKVPKTLCRLLCMVMALCIVMGLGMSSAVAATAPRISITGCPDTISSGEKFSFNYSITGGSGWLRTPVCIIEEYVNGDWVITENNLMNKTSGTVTYRHQQGEQVFVYICVFNSYDVEEVVAENYVMIDVLQDSTGPVEIVLGALPSKKLVGETIVMSYNVSGQYTTLACLVNAFDASGNKIYGEITELSAASGAIRYTPTEEGFVRFFFAADDLYGNTVLEYVEINVLGESAYAAVYNYDYYTSQHPDLAAAFNGDRVAALHHFISSGMAEGRQGNPDFNVNFYRANYADLEAAFGDNLASYYTHYINTGNAEGRVANVLLSPEIPEAPGVEDNESAYAAVYDFDYYTSKYPDVAAAFNGDRAATLDHFINNGMAEGRQGNSSFNVDCYKANYADIASAFGNDLKAYYTHYMSNGKAENRVADQLLASETPEQPAQPSIDERESYYAAVYDFDYYTNKYPDVAAAFNGDRAATLDHFIHHGMHEGRQGNADFNVDVYRVTYQDLQAAFGSHLDDYYKHYINHGKAEGRSGR